MINTSDLSKRLIMVSTLLKYLSMIQAKIDLDKLAIVVVNYMLVDELYHNFTFTKAKAGKDFLELDNFKPHLLDILKQ